MATRHGEFKIAKQTGTTAHFARVTVSVVGSDTEQVTVSAPEGSVRGWREAAILGGLEAARELRDRGVVEGPVHVDITAFVGIPTDTSDDDARGATFMAVMAAYPDVAPPTLNLRADNGWEVVWPE